MFLSSSQAVSLLWNFWASFVDNPKRNEFASSEKTFSKELEREQDQEGDSVAGIWTKFSMRISSQKLEEMHWDIWEDGQQPGGAEQRCQGRPCYLKGAPNSSCQSSLLASGLREKESPAPDESSGEQQF